MSAKKYHVKLTAVQRQELRQLVRTGRESARKIIRARILLKADQNDQACDDQSIAEELEIGLATVERIRKRFATQGLIAALEAKPQPPRPEKRILDGASEAKLTMLACSSPPEGHDHWTLDLLADRMIRLEYVSGGACSRDTVWRALKKMNLSLG